MKTKFVLLIAVVVAGLLPSCKDLEDQVKEQVKTMDGVTQLGTVEYTIKKLVRVDHDAFYKIGERKIIFSCKSYMKAGIDLDKFSAEDIKVDKKNKTINIELPQAEILSFNMPIEDAVLEYESVSGIRSDFTADDRMNFLTQGEKNILGDSVLMRSIMQDAENNATLFFEALFARVGAENINITFKNEENHE